MTAELILASESATTGIRLTTMAITMPKSLVAELNTHRAFSRNSASSRAMPILKVIEQVAHTPYTPPRFGKHNTGMQPAGYFDEDEAFDLEWRWVDSARRAAESAVTLAFSAYDAQKIIQRLDRGESLVGLEVTPLVAKEVVNRLLEPFMTTRVIVSSTEWENFLTLRDHPDAQIDMQMIARAVRRVLDDAEYEILQEGEWHLPFLDDCDKALPLEEQVLLSASACAKVSYLRDGVPMGIDSATRLWGAGHLSPFEHTARVQSVAPTLGNFRGWEQARHVPPVNMLTLLAE